MQNRSIAERFAIPHTFAPNMSVGEAIVASLAAMARILLGSLLFAVWGVYTIRLYNAIGSPLWRTLVLFPLLLLFAFLFGGLMFVISAIMRKLTPQRT